MTNRVYSYEYTAPGMGETSVGHILVPPGLDAKSYLRGRQDEMKEAGIEVFAFEPAPAMRAFDVHRTLASGLRDIWREFFPSLEAAQQSWSTRTGDYVASVEIVEAHQ